MSNSQIISNILYPIEYSYGYTEVPTGYPTLSIAYLIYSTSHMDVRMEWSFIEPLRHNEWCFATTFTKLRAGGLLGMLSYSVSWYWCKCIWGFQLQPTGTFLWKPGTRRDPTCSPRPYLHRSFVYASLLFSPVGRRQYMFSLLCCTLVTTCLLTHPGRAEDQGYRRQYIYCRQK